MNILKDRVALITGASRGIGKAISQRFSAEGAKVIISASRMGEHGDLEGTLESTRNEILASGGEAKAISADLTNIDERFDLIKRAEEIYGPIDILVNNAAGSINKLPSEMNSKDRSWMFDLNLNAPIDLAQQVLPSMRRRNVGWILNISSSASTQPAVPYPDSQLMAHMIGAYGATKAALNRYTMALAHEVFDDGVCINTLAPESIVLTAGSKYVEFIAKKRPDLVEPVEMMAEAALLLCSKNILGQNYTSRQCLHTFNQPLYSLDGSSKIGDAFTAGDLEKV